MIKNDVFYLNETKLFKDDCIPKRCHCKKEHCICICDDMILNKKCVCRLFLNQEEMDDEIEIAKNKNEEIRKTEIENVFYLGKTKYKKLDNVEKTIKELLKRKANFLDFREINECK